MASLNFIRPMRTKVLVFFANALSAVSVLLRTMREGLNPLPEATEPDALDEHAPAISRTHD